MYTFFKTNKWSKYFSFFLQFCILNTTYYSYSAVHKVTPSTSSGVANYYSQTSWLHQENFNKQNNLKNRFFPRNVKKKKVVNTPNPKNNIQVIPSDIKQGKIGADKNGYDDISDNIFKLDINLKTISEDKEFYLVYDLKGIDKSTLPSRSINYRQVTGGYIIKTNNKWQRIEEKIDKSWLHQGTNAVFFSTPYQADYNYSIKNLQILIKDKTQSTDLITLRNVIGFNQEGNHIYIDGFLNLNKDIQNSELQLFVNKYSVPVINNQFEYKLDSSSTDKLNLILYSNNKLIEKKQYSVTDFIVPDKLYHIEPLHLALENKQSEKITKNYLVHQETKISLEKLRNIDIPKFESNFVNVTKEQSVFRINTNALKIKDSTFFKLFTEYDPVLLPEGYTPKDIQTFHFDKDYKKWLPIARDTLLENTNVIVSISNQEGDYVNGIIKVPESPQTSSFTPTMMNDIKAADPSSEMTIISPPEVSQKGAANVSYPIKIPAGRNGLQPQVVLQYNSDRGNSWLGEGWDISIPAISIDTRWGTPTFSSVYETEMYMLNGEQLMYPKQDGEDWMPNRHYDVSGASSGTFSTQPIERTSNLVFTPRKQGSFSKIERLESSAGAGNVTANYFWKVTDTNGTIYWYGGKNGIVSNAVIKNSNNDIVHWGLYMVQDVFGNTIKYTYNNTTLSGQSGSNTNLNGGKIFHINTILYSGFNDNDYKYAIEFVSSSTLRQDVAINARLGIKQIEPYFLEEIHIKNNNNSTANTIRTYKFTMGTGKFNKGQLQDVAEYKGNNLFYKHSFDYYDDVSVDGTDVYFTDDEIEVICDDEELPCPDNDGDGICNEDDSCPDVAGPVANNGCPEVVYCYEITISDYIILKCVSQGVNVYFNGNLLSLGGTTVFNSISQIAAAIQQTYPTATYTQNTIIIPNLVTQPSSLNLEIIRPQNQYVCLSDSFKPCTTTKNTGEVYRQFFSDLLNNNSFSVENGISLENPCETISVNDEFILSGYVPSFDSSSSLLGSSKSRAMSAGFYIGIGIGGNRITKSTTFGVQWNRSNDRSLAFTSLIDINGDGLSDIVSKKNGGLYYKQHIITRTYNSDNEPVVVHSFSPQKPIMGIDNFYRAFGRGSSRNFQITFGFAGAGGFVGKDKSKSKSETDIFFTDGNGDGLIDIVRDGVVYFNRLDANGNPNFIPDSQGTENLVITAAPIDVEVPDEYNEETITFPAFDVVKVWEAPINGVIVIDNDITLTDLTKEAVVTVEKRIYPNNTGSLVSETNSLSNNLRVNQTDCSVDSDDLCLLFGDKLDAANPHISNILSIYCVKRELYVEKGDRIYFRVHSVEQGNPPVDWNPSVRYQNFGYNTITDANNHTPFSSSYSDGFVLSNKEPTTFPGNSGTAKISWTPFTITPTDTVTYQIIKETVVAGGGTGDIDVVPTVISSDVIYTKTCSPNVSSTIAPIASPINLNNITVSSSGNNSLERTYFYFKVTSTSNIDWKSAVWQPELEATTTTPISPNQDGSNPEGNAVSVIKLYPVPDYDLYRIYPCGTTFFKKDITAIANQSTLQITPNLSGLFNASDNGTINFVVKRGTVFKGSRTLTIANGNISGNTSPIALGSSGANDIEIMYTVDDSNSNGTSTSLLNKLALTSNPLAFIQYQNTSNSVYKDELTLYQKANPIHGYFFRQWGQFFYNPANVQNALPTGVEGTNFIKEDALTASLSQADATTLNTDLQSVNNNMTAADLDAFEASHMNYINNLAFLQATPSREIINGEVTDRWIGFHRENYASESSFRAASFEQGIIDMEEGYQSIEQGVLNTGAYAISKYAKGHSNNNFSGGVSAYGIGVNASISNNGASNMLTDYVDYNGDRYPDIVSTEKIQFTNKTGGLLGVTNKPHEYVSVSSSDSFGFGASGSFGKSSDEGGDKSGKKFGFERFDGFNGNSGSGISGNFSSGNSITKRFWIDINGDGLSDLLEETNGSATNITLNYGPTTPNATSTNWGVFSIFKSESKGVSGGLGINKWNGSFEAGISLTSSWNKTTKTLKDINGDGLLDVIYSDDDLGVKLNIGNKFVDKGVWNTQYNLKKETASIAASINAGVTFAFVWRLWFISFKIPAININGTPISTTTNKTLKTITDYDGDGYPDLLEQTSPNTIKVCYSRIRRTDKLKMVTNPLGGKFIIDYKVQKVDYNNPNPKWVMSSLEIDDNYDKVNDGTDVYKKQFEYEEGRYDRREREFYGYKKVKTIELNPYGQTKGEVYRTSVSIYNNESYFLNGLVLENYVCKGDDENKKFFKNKYNYHLYKLNNSNDEIDFSTVLPTTYDVGGHEGRRSACVLLAKTIKEIYELNTSTNFITEIEYQYDTKGRIISYLNKGDLATTTDDYVSKINYHNLVAPHILNIPETITVIEADSGNVKKERRTEVEPANGNIKRVLARNGNSWAITEMEYDNYGNLSNIKYPPNASGESVGYAYKYDTDFNKYPIKITHTTLGYSSSATYDSNFDKPLEVIDIANNVTTYKYDIFGRTINIVAPKEKALGKEYTIKFEYYPQFNDLPSGTTITATDFVPVAVTKHFDVQHPNNDIETYTFIDGLARPIQVKKDIEINIGTYANPILIEAMSVSGKTKYDAYGRAVESFHPWWEDKSITTNFLLNEHHSSTSSKIVQDEMNRTVKTIDEEGNIATTQFSIDTDINNVLCLKTLTTVAQNGSQNIVTATYHDSSGKLVSTKNVGGTNGSIWTQYKYNAIGELLNYTDAEGITTSYEYDMFGRKTQVNHPDKGTTRYLYDNVNLIALQTQNLLNQGTSISYKYSDTQLQAVIFPDMPTGNNIANVTYRYGTTGNATGRVIAITDATGIQEFEYGNMGEVTTISRVIVAPNLPTRLFKTRFTYDSFNRIQYVTYPDGEQVNYYYNKGGNVIQMIGEQNHFDYKYIDRIDYDHYEQKTYMYYGNNTETFYTYTPELRRLNNLKVTASDGQEMLNNRYSYDKVGNITNITNIAPYNTTNYLGGTYFNDYDYDNLNRLTFAGGSFTGYGQVRQNPNHGNDYKLKMSYTDTHGIKMKHQDHIRPIGLPVQINSYTNEYGYFSGTHKVAEIVNAQNNTVETIDYDANGNMLTSKSNRGFSRRLFWDEANRLRVVEDKDKFQHYIYDNKGVRTLKASSLVANVYQNGQLVNNSTVLGAYTTYVNEYLVLTPDQQFSKHYYNGTERVAARIGTQRASIFNTKSSTQNTPVDIEALRTAQITDLEYYLSKTKDTKKITIQPIKEIVSKSTLPMKPRVYYFHSDHLGSGTFLSDISGNPYQFFLNLPFGETMVEQHSNSGNYTNNYKFNGKELDEETGFYYYGARYYNPRLSLWLSVDPLAEKFPSWTPYHFVHNNPINLIDPDGRAAVPPGDYYDKDGVYLGNDGIDDNKVYQLKDNYRAKFENTKVNWGGTLSEKHYAEIQSKSNDLGTVQDAFVTGDAVSDKRIQSLHPAIRMEATDFIKEANANSSETLIRVAQGFRTYTEQDALYAKGRTAGGSKVTNAKGGFSNHNFGLAFDIVGITNGKVDYNLDWKSLSTIGKNNNFDWGGDWKSFKDKPHFENMFGNSLKDLRALPKDNNGLPILKE